MKPIMPGTFLCGCSLLEKQGYAANVDNAGNISFHRYDDQGFRVCPEHGFRLYGWNSQSVEILDDQGRLVRTAIDYSAMGRGRNKKLNLDFHRAEEKRDDRDPQEIGRGVLAGGNGHA